MILDETIKRYTRNAEKDIGIACIHYEEAHDVEPQESEVEE